MTRKNAALATISDVDEDRFWSKVERDPEGCWLWIGAVNEFGRGRFWLNAVDVLAPRVAAKLTVPGFMLELYVLHTCDNPQCVRPSHLWLGTQPLNMWDCIRKGRHTSCRNKRPQQPVAVDPWEDESCS